jgi:hypothetical protein
MRLPGDSIVVIPLAVFSTVDPAVSEDKPFSTVAVPVDAVIKNKNNEQL